MTDSASAVDPSASLLYTNLVLLFACRLDDQDRNCGSAAKDWKRKPIEACCSENEETRSFLTAWLDHGAELAPGPIVGWFEERSFTPVEERMRANAVRQLVERSISTGSYDSRVRAALQVVSADAGISWKAHIVLFEGILAGELAKAFMARQGPAKTQSSWTLGRLLQVSAAAAVGGTLVALTAGAAAPIVAPVLGGILMTNASVSLALSIGLFGAAGAGLTGYKMADRTRRGLKEFFFEAVKVNCVDEPLPSLHVVIGVPGCLPSDDLSDLNKFWAEAFNLDAEDRHEANTVPSEAYFLVYDRQELLEYSNKIGNLLKDRVVSYAYGYFLQQVVSQAILAAIAAPMKVVEAANFINNSFVKCESRAADAGIELAYALRSGCYGSRPVSLVGVGFGALAIFHALEELERECAFGIVENVILVCAPLRADPSRWGKVRSITAGHLVNVYCEDDWTLKLVMSWSVSSATIAGVQRANVQGVQDVLFERGHYAVGVDGGKSLRELIEQILPDL